MKHLLCTSMLLLVVGVSVLWPSHCSAASGIPKAAAVGTALDSSIIWPFATDTFVIPILMDLDGWEGGVSDYPQYHAFQDITIFELRLNIQLVKHDCYVQDSTYHFRSSPNVRIQFNTLHHLFTLLYSGDPNISVLFYQRSAGLGFTLFNMLYDSLQLNVKDFEIVDHVKDVTFSAHAASTGWEEDAGANKCSRLVCFADTLANSLQFAPTISVNNIPLGGVVDTVVGVYNRNVIPVAITTPLFSLDSAFQLSQKLLDTIQPHSMAYVKVHYSPELPTKDSAQYTFTGHGVGYGIKFIGKPAAPLGFLRTVNFGALHIGELKDTLIQLTNLSQRDIRILSVQVQSPDSSFTLMGASLGPLAAGLNSWIAIRYSPLRRVFSVSAQCVCTTEIGMDTILLAGFVLYPYLSVPSTLPLLVTNIDSTISHTIVIRNDGLETIHLQSIAVSNPAGFNLTTVALPHKLNYRDSLVVNVHFTPQSTDTVYATVTYASDSGVIASTRISGLGTKPLAVESPSPSSISCEIIPSVCEKNAMLNVRSSLMGKALISIRNMLGVTLCTTTAEFVNGYLTVPIQTGTFPNGPYFLTLTTQETVRTVKFIVRR